MTTTAIIQTPITPGAVAIIQLVGDVEPVLSTLTDVSDWPTGAMRLVGIGGIDRGVVTRLHDDVAQLMPHGGVRIVQRLGAMLCSMGIELSAATDVDPSRLYPEAADEHEARVLLALARAESPLAIDLLLDQPARLRNATAPSEDDLARSRRLDRLIDPPCVVLAGEPNVGKSTLSNTLHGRAVSIAADLPGTTRDYTVGRIDLAGLVVDWHDTPGLRQSADPIEARAIEIAARLAHRADLLIALADSGSEWPTLPRAPDLRVGSKADLTARDDCDLNVSARTGAGIADLVTRVRELLVPQADLDDPRPWFTAR